MYVLSLRTSIALLKIVFFALAVCLLSLYPARMIYSGDTDGSTPDNVSIRDDKDLNLKGVAQ